jgi:hypothetical protein
MEHKVTSVVLVVGEILRDDREVGKGGRRHG